MNRSIQKNKRLELKSNKLREDTELWRMRLRKLQENLNLIFCLLIMTVMIKHSALKGYSKRLKDLKDNTQYLLQIVLKDIKLQALSISKLKDNQIPTYLVIFPKYQQYRSTKKNLNFAHQNRSWKNCPLNYTKLKVMYSIIFLSYF